MSLAVTLSVIVFSSPGLPSLRYNEIMMRHVVQLDGEIVCREIVIEVQER